MKHGIFLFCIFIFLLLSFSVNLWQLAPQYNFEMFDNFDKGLVYGKIARSEKDGIFSNGGFPGINYNSKDTIGKNRDEVFISNMLMQKDIYLGKLELPSDFYPYRSQIGTQVILYSYLNKILPFSTQTKIFIFDLINAFFNALIFILFFWWILKNYGFLATTITFVFIAFSWWLIMFNSNIWWVAGSFYLPVFGLLILFHKVKNDNTILIGLFFLFLAKCLLTGFEFITCSILSVFIPIVYYFFLRKKNLKDFFIFSFKAGIICCLAIFIMVLIIAIQHKFLFGTFTSGFNNLIEAFSRRSVSGTDNLSDILSVFTTYMDGTVLRGKIFGQYVHFYIVIITVYLNMILLYLIVRKRDDSRIYKALILATSVSIIPSISWYCIFVNHALIHPHIDYICWYMPFLLFGFLSLGVSVSNVFIKNR